MNEEKGSRRTSARPTLKNATPRGSSRAAYGGEKVERERAKKAEKARTREWWRVGKSAPKKKSQILRAGGQPVLL